MQKEVKVISENDESPPEVYLDESNKLERLKTDEGINKLNSRRTESQFLPQVPNAAEAEGSMNERKLSIQQEAYNTVKSHSKNNPI